MTSPGKSETHDRRRGGERRVSGGMTFDAMLSDPLEAREKKCCCGVVLEFGVDRTARKLPEVRREAQTFVFVMKLFLIGWHCDSPGTRKDNAHRNRSRRWSTSPTAGGTILKQAGRAHGPSWTFDFHLRACYGPKCGPKALRCQRIYQLNQRIEKSVCGLTMGRFVPGRRFSSTSSLAGGAAAPSA